MKKWLSLIIGFCFVLGLSSMAFAKNPMKANEKKVHNEFCKIIPKSRWITAQQLHEEWLKRKQGKSNAYLIDVRTDAEFNAFHIEGTDHIQAGHMYVIPKKIPDPNAKIIIFCRTKHRASYVAAWLIRYGYKNVYVVDGGVLAWAKAGYPFVNWWTGEFKITRYRQHPSKFEKQGYKLRMWSELF